MNLVYDWYGDNLKLRTDFDALIFWLDDSGLGTAEVMSALDDLVCMRLCGALESELV